MKKIEKKTMGHNSGTTKQTHKTAEGPEGYQPLTWGPLNRGALEKQKRMLILLHSCNVVVVVVVGTNTEIYRNMIKQLKTWKLPESRHF